MFMVLKKKRIYAYVLLILSVIVLGCIFNNSAGDSDIKTSLNHQDETILPDNGDAVIASTDTNDFKIEKIKNDRDVVRSKSLEILNSVIDNPNTSPENKQIAETDLINTASNINKESDCEKLLQSKGYGECVVFISEDIVTVSIIKNNLENTDIVVINDIIYSQTGNNNIKIVEVE